MEWTPSYQELQDECNFCFIASGVGVCRTELQPNFLSALQVKNERVFLHTLCKASIVTYANPPSTVYIPQVDCSPMQDAIQ